MRRGASRVTIIATRSYINNPQRLYILPVFVDCASLSSPIIWRGFERGRMSLAKLIETSDVRTQDDPSQIGGGSSSPGLTQRTGDRTMQPVHRRCGLRERGVKVQSAGSRTPRRSRRALIVIASLI